MNRKCFMYCAGSYYDGYVIPSEADFVVAVDGGYEHLKKLGIKPQLAVGDFDSLGFVPQNVETVCHPAVKDDTDTVLAAKLMLEKGYKNFYIFAAFGGREDHSYANYQLLTWLSRRGADVFAFDDGYAYTAVHNATIIFDKCYEGVVSTFCAGEVAQGVTMTGLKYTLDNAMLTCDNPTGVSNEFIGESATISVKEGTLLVMFERKSDITLPLIIR